MTKPFSVLLLFVSIYTFSFIYGCKSNHSTDTDNSKENKINTWYKLTNGLPINTAYTIAKIEGKLYVFANYYLYSSSDNGDSWQKIGAGLPDSIWINAIAGKNNYLVAATDGKGVFVSSNYGMTWIEPNNNGLDIRSMYVHSIEMDSNFIFIGAGVNATVYRSSDFGNNWTSFSNGLPITTEQYYPKVFLLVHFDSLLFACPQASGLYFSKNNGLNWYSNSDGLPFHSTIWNLAISDSYYFSTVLPISSNEQGLFRRSLSNSTWSRIPIDISDSSPHFIVAKGSTILLSTDSGIKISFDNGNSWNLCNKGLDDLTYSELYDAIIVNDYVFVVNNYNAIWRYSLK